MDKLSRMCECKGLVIANWGLHMLKQPFEIPPAIPDPLPWSFPFGRVKGLTSLFQQYANLSSRENVQLMWASSMRVDETVYMLWPSSGEYRNFAQFNLVEQWAQFDRALTANHSIPYLPSYELSIRYRGMEGDGMHFASFPVVEDVLAQVLFQKVCANKPAALC